MHAPEAPQMPGGGTLRPLPVRGCALLDVPVLRGGGGLLSYVEFEGLPFAPRRSFVVSVRSAPAARGGHAHRSCEQLLQCTSGTVKIALDDGRDSSSAPLEVTLVPDGPALLVGSLVWSTLQYLSPGSALFVLCSEPHDPDEYIRDRACFLSLARRGVSEPPAPAPHAAWQVLQRATATAPGHADAPAAAPAVPLADVRAAAWLVDAGLRAAFDRVLRSGRYTLNAAVGASCEVAAFEAEWATFCGAAHCAAVGSGAAALQLMLLAAGIGPGDEVVVASNSYPATVFAVIHAGACPVLVEPDPATRNLSAASAASAFTARTRAVLATDMYGAPIDYAGLSAAAHARSAWLFTDASHAHGAEAGGRPAGGLADAAAYSHYPTKNLGALGEAGSVVTNFAALAARMRALRDYGRAPVGTALPPAPQPPRPRAQQPQQLQQEPLQPPPQQLQQEPLQPPPQQLQQEPLQPPRQPPQFEVVGFNERMDPLQAALLRAKLPHLPAQLAARRRIAARYLDALRGLHWLRLPQVAANTAPAWHLFVVECDKPARRDALRAHLAARGVEAAVHYPTPPHLTPALRGHPLLRVAGSGGSAAAFRLPVAEGLAGRVLSLPVCPSLSEGQVGRVIDAVLEFGGRSKL